MKIIYLFRHPQIGFSLHKVFKPVIERFQKQETVNIYEMPFKGSMPWDVVKNCKYVLKKREKNSIHHITGHIHDILLALMGYKTVLTIHDLVFLDNVTNPIKRMYKWLFWLYLPIKIADKVVCISNATKSNILQHLKTNKLTVIYNAVDPKFKYCPKVFNEKKPVILHIGTGWNKNLNRTVEALKDIRCQLRIIGKLNDEQIKLLNKYNVEYSNQFNLSDDEIQQEYINCDIVNFPSEYEGFGMPIIEGQKTGRIVVTSQLEPLIEVSGDAVLYVDPYSIDSIRKAYISIIKNNELRESLIQKGLKNTERFSLDLVSEQYHKLYHLLELS